MPPPPPFFLTEGEREREREFKWGRDREKGRERIPSRVHAVSMEPDAGLNPMNREIMT